MNKILLGSILCLSLGSWVAQPEDNICGIKNVQNVSNPAVIDWSSAMNITKEIKTLKKHKIDRKSARGRLLIADATDKVARASNFIMNKIEVDSVWKKITHPTKKALNITQRVKDKINENQKVKQVKYNYG
jgi:hypothetical protein|tara:strand:+ start:777 stop:1169 length:393 start_codon:yes stop_codon:yes gene_type:complete